MARARLNGTITHDGEGLCEYRFQYGTTIALGTYTPWRGGHLHTGDPFHEDVTNLNDYTRYYFQAECRNSGGVGTSGSILSFITTGKPATVHTTPATSISEFSAVLHGSIIADGGAGCETRFEYGSTANYGNFTAWVSGAVTGSVFEEMIENLSMGGPVHYRALARNPFGVSAGPDQSFTTLIERNRTLFTGELMYPLMGG